MGNVDIYLDVGLMALINRTFTVESTTLDEVQLEIEQLGDGRLRFGSLILDETTESDWLFDIRQLTMSNSEIRYISHELTTTLTVHSASVYRVYTRFSKEHGEANPGECCGATRR